MKKLIIKAIAMLAAFGAHGQGTLVFDQQVSPTTAPGVFFNIAPDPTGESFIPSLSSIGFVQFYFDDSANGLGSTIAVNLWSGSIGNGTLLGTSEAVSMPDGFNGASTFLFTTPVNVTAGTTYYLQPFIQSGNIQLGIVGNNYPNGAGYLHGVQLAGDFWFREGIAVPEPSIFSLSFIGLAGLCAVLWNRRERPLNTAKEIADWNFDCLGYAQQSFNRNNLFAALNLSKIFRVQIGLFCKPFLRKVCFLAIKANGLTDDPSVSQYGLSIIFAGRHAPEK